MAPNETVYVFKYQEEAGGGSSGSASADTSSSRQAAQGLAKQASDTSNAEIGRRLFDLAAGRFAPLRAAGSAYDQAQNAFSLLGGIKPGGKPAMAGQATAAASKTAGPILAELVEPPIYGAAGGAAAAGGAEAAVGAGGALAALGGPVGIAIAGTAAALAGVQTAAKMLSDRFKTMSGELAKYSAEISLARAMNEVADVQFNMERAARYGAALGEFDVATGRLGRAATKTIDEAIAPLIPVITAGADALAKILEYVNLIEVVVGPVGAALLRWLPGVAKANNPIDNFGDFLRSQGVIK